LGKPIQCWIPQEFTRGWEEYAENYCWVSNTYFSPLPKRLPPTMADRENSRILYYQWAPILMAIQALLFYLPCLIWRLFNSHSGFNVRRIMQMANDSNLLLPEHGVKNSRPSHRRTRKLPLNPITESSPAGACGLTSPAERAELARRGGKSTSRSYNCCGRRSGNFLVVLYFFVKGLYLINIVGQLILMEKFIGTNTAFYGIRVLIDLLQGSDWHTSGNFPRVTFCDFEAKKLGKNQLYTIQCVLPLNMFLEKIFIFLWFWHCTLGVITLITFINWFLRMGFARYRLKFIRRYLKIMSVMKDTDKTTSKKFVENFLRPDGIFLIRLISMNVGDMMAGDLACELWQIYRHKRAQDVVAEEMKYIEPIPNYLGHPQPPGLRHHHPEIGFITAPAPPRTSGGGGSGEKVVLSMSNGDDSIV
uniref:Innexin n=1 Tax=Mesocestoides corti TaxID=53468 RepID=A0A5K3EJF9_MESCO